MPLNYIQAHWIEYIKNLKLKLPLHKLIVS